MTISPQNESADALFAGPGDIRARCRSIDWSATPLGPTERWPKSLRLAVRMCLDARFPMAIWAGPALVLIYNDGYPPVLGPARHPWALGRPAREVWAEVWDRLAPELERVVQHGESTHHEDERFLLQRGRGEEEMFFTYSFTPIQEDDGQTVGALNVFLETTERVHALRQRTALLHAISDSSTDVIFAKDLSGRILFANPATLALVGKPAAQVVGKTDLEFLDDKEAARRVMANDRRVMDSGTPCQLEEIVPLPDGTPRVWHSLKTPYRDAAGRVIGLLGISRDITDRKQAEENLRRSREGLSHLAAASLDVIRPTNLEGMLQAISEAALTLTGARMATSAHGLVNGRFKFARSATAPFAPADSAGGVFRLEQDGACTALFEGSDAIRLTDSELRSQVQALGLPESHAPMRGLLGVRMLARDGKTSGMILVTDKEHGEFTEEDEALLRQLATVAALALEHVEARISLEESDRRKNEFLAMLSHELRNPLAPIRNSLYILDHAKPGGEQAHRAQTVIDRQIRHMTRLVDDLLDVTRISRGMIQLQRERLDLCDVARRAVEDYRDAFAQNHLELELALPEQALWVNGDRTRVSQVIGNLLHNAAKFTPPGGKAFVSVGRSDHDGGQAILRVRDTGIGIAPEMLPRLFEPFSQADRTLDRSKGGLGLGLALVKRLVEMHGGTASVESGGLGHGTEFTVRLPLEAAEDSTATATGGTVTGASRRVLVIEDNLDAAESLREVLQFGDHEVEVAYSGPEGLEKARAFKPDVVICDIGLPGMDGYEVARAIRADSVLRGIRLAALTGYAAAEDIARSSEAGFDSHLAKPPSIEKLEQFLATVPRLGLGLPGAGGA